MDAFIDSAIQLLIEWGLPGLFISALLAGSIVPFSSELVLVALVKLGLPPIACLISATLGNTVGGEVIAIALGFMRSNTWLTIVSMFVGKLIRYILLLYVLESAWDAMAG